MLTSTPTPRSTPGPLSASPAHMYSVPVVRELPRPVPHGLGSTAW